MFACTRDITGYSPALQICLLYKLLFTLPTATYSTYCCLLYLLLSLYTCCCLLYLLPFTLYTAVYSTYCYLIYLLLFTPSTAVYSTYCYLLYLLLCNLPTGVLLNLMLFDLPAAVYSTYYRLPYLLPFTYVYNSLMKLLSICDLSDESLSHFIDSGPY